MVDAAPRSPPSLAELFACGLEIALRSFGGAAAWTRHVLVERRAVLTDEEFTELFGLAQLVPGPTVVSLLCLVGDRARGLRGALAAFLGIFVLPCAGVVALDALLMRWVHVAWLGRALAGLGAAAAGLVVAMGLKMAARFRGDPIPIGIAAVALVLGGPCHVALPIVVLVTAVPGLLWARRRSA